MARLIVDGNSRVRSRTTPATAPPFSPTDISGLVLWYDPTRGVTDAGSGAVSQWNDQSSTGANATQGTSANRPTTGTRTQNGLNLIDFKGTDDYLIVPTISLGLTASTMVVVGGEDTAVNFAGFITLNAGSTNDYDNTNSIALDTFDNTGFAEWTGNNNSVFLSGVGVTPFDIWACRKSGGGSNQATIQRGSGSPTTGTVASTGTATQGFLGCRRVGGAASNFLDGPVGDILVYNNDIGTGPLATLISWLKTRWAL